MKICIMMLGLKRVNVEWNPAISIGSGKGNDRIVSFCLGQSNEVAVIIRCP